MKEIGQPAVAITDHGNLHGIIEFYKEAQKEGIHPVIGCEVYFSLDRTVRAKPAEKIAALAQKYCVEPKQMEAIIKAVEGAPERSADTIAEYGLDAPLEELLLDIDSLGTNIYHLVLLARNQEGLKNLYHIVTDAYQNGFYYKPRTDLSVLRERGRGLIALTACLAGRLPYLLLAGLYEEAEKFALELASCLDGLYFEIQPNSMPAQAIANARLAELSKKLGLPLVVTCDVHYLTPEDYEAHDVLLCIQTNKTLEDEERLRFTSDFWLKTESEVREQLAYLDADVVSEAVENTIKIAEDCRVEFEFGKLKFPIYEVPGGRTPEEELRRICRGELLRYALEKDIDIAKYQRQLNYELDVICSAGFAPYFLITQDFTSWARKNGIPVGPGRGSAAGSLVTFLLGITGLDPLEHGLLFERFLNKERIEMPDIDVDFSYEHRDMVINYAAERYGRDRLAHICTFHIIKPKMAVKDVGRVLGISYQVRDEITKQIPDDAATIEEALENSPLLREYQAQYPKLFELAAKIQNMPRHVSTHASGIVIAPGPIVEFLPLFVDKHGNLVTQFEMNTVAELGLVKFDFLG